MVLYFVISQSENTCAASQSITKSFLHSRWVPVWTVGNVWQALGYMLSHASSPLELIITTIVTIASSYLSYYAIGTVINVCMMPDLMLTVILRDKQVFPNLIAHQHQLRNFITMSPNQDLLSQNLWVKNMKSLFFSNFLRNHEAA